MRSFIGLLVAIALIALLTAPTIPQAQETGGFLDLLGLGDADEYADPEEIMTWVELPRSVKRGEEVTLKITIENGRKDDDFQLSTIDVGEEFMAGFQLVSVDPKPRQQDQLLGILTLEYPVDLAAGETSTYEIRLRSMTPGIFIGDVDINEGQRWLTRAAQIRISD